MILTHNQPTVLMLSSDPRRSEGPICDTVGNSMMFSVLFFQLAMVFFFKHKDDSFLAALTSVLFLLTFLIWLQQVTATPTTPSTTLQQAGRHHSFLSRSLSLSVF